MTRQRIWRIVEDHVSEAIRDIPRSCLCFWVWDNFRARWNRDKLGRECPWHTGK